MSEASNKINTARSVRSALDRKKVFRFETPDNLSTRLFDQFEEVAESVLVVLEYLIPEQQNLASGFLEFAANMFKQLHDAPDQEYGASNTKWINNVAERFQNWRDQRRDPSHIGLAILLSGTLSPVSAAELRSAVDVGLKSLKDAELSIAARAKELEDQAVAKAKRKIDEARLTARGDSMTAAQDQFKAARKRANAMAGLFAVLGLVFTAGLIITAAIMYKGAIDIARTAASQPDQGEIGWAPTISLLAIKLVILSTLAYVTSMCWRSFRAYLHMSELNAHRVHVANCIGAFAAAAQVGETEDVVLIRMMESVIAFGNSGLLPHDDDTIAGQKIALEPGSLLPKPTSSSS
jgi:hypothetical protein